MLEPLTNMKNRGYPHKEERIRPKEGSKWTMAEQPSRAAYTIMFTTKLRKMLYRRLDLKICLAHLKELSISSAAAAAESDQSKREHRELK